MKTSWKTEAGQIACRWSETGPVVRDPLWFEADAENWTGYLQPIPHFASHSPFGGAYWFQPMPLIAFFE